MNENFMDLMRAATTLVQTGRLGEATQTLQRFWTSTPEAPAAAHEQGSFVEGTHSHGALTRDYKLFAPPGATGQARPLVVMLHGGGQDPDDFAAGTAMNEHAREQGFFVLYPAQAPSANPQRCWNWFDDQHQQRDSGEPGLIADLTHSLVARHGIDRRRVFVAGLSAGGAMAAIVAAAHPEVFAAVGVHSGLAAGAASDLGGALDAMRCGAAAGDRGAGAVPTIVFHGDEDATVHPRNGEHVIAAALGGSAVPRRSAARVEAGISARGRRYTRRSYKGRRGGGAPAEHWLVHGAGHAWSGGDSAGSYTDASGPDATTEMLRFFFAHPLAAATEPS